MRLEIPVGERAIVLETGKLARQAGGSSRPGWAIPWCCPPRPAPRRPDRAPRFCPERRHRGEDVLGGQDSRRLHQAGQTFREGYPDLPANGQAPGALFPKGYHYEIQVIGTVLVADQETPYDTVSMVGASAALSLSDIPYDGPIGAVRVGRDPDGGFILNPTYQQLAESDLDLVVAGTRRPLRWSRPAPMR